MNSDPGTFRDTDYLESLVGSFVEVEYLHNTDEIKFLVGWFIDFLANDPKPGEIKILIRYSSKLQYWINTEDIISIERKPTP